MFGRIVEIGVVGGNPSRGMSFETVSELIKELLTYIGGNIIVEDKVVVHEDVLKIENRRVGNDLTGRGVEVRVNFAGGRSRFGGYSVGPRIGMAEGIVRRRRMLRARAAGRCELV